MTPVSKSAKEKKRLDVTLVERGLAETRQRAQALILEGKVLVDGQKEEKAGAGVRGDVVIELVGEACPYASRGGLKLAGALEDFGLSVEGYVCLDVGSSTGGFTDCLLQRGAKRVYAVDVNVAQLDWKLRKDKRVMVVKANARYLTEKEVPERVDFACVDVSFISVRKVLPAIVELLDPRADLVVLVKPQFELERKEVGKGGIVRDARLRAKAVESVQDAVEELGLGYCGARASRIVGAKGNQEYFVLARRK